MSSTKKTDRGFVAARASLSWFFESSPFSIAGQSYEPHGAGAWDASRIASLHARRLLEGHGVALERHRRIAGYVAALGVRRIVTLDNFYSPMCGDWVARAAFSDSDGVHSRVRVALGTIPADAHFEKRLPGKATGYVQRLHALEGDVRHSPLPGWIREANAAARDVLNEVFEAYETIVRGESETKAEEASPRLDCAEPRSWL